MLSRLKHWLPAIAVAAMISTFSSHYFSSDATFRFFYPILHWLFPTASRHWIHLMHVGIRKLAHVTEFGVFSVTIFHGIRGDRRGWRVHWAFLTLLIAVAFATVDEFHQMFVPGRQASARDVAIDALGAVLAQVLVWAYANWRRVFTAPPSLPAGSSAEK
jgi:VanZ family protein